MLKRIAVSKGSLQTLHSGLGQGSTTSHCSDKLIALLCVTRLFNSYGGVMALNY